MKILHVVPMYFPAVRYGGPIYSVHGLASAQAAWGHQVDVVTTNIDGNTDSPVPIDADVYRDGVNIRYFQTKVFRRLYWSAAMAKYLFRKIASYDVVHVHLAYGAPMVLASAAARIAGVPYVVSPRGTLVLDMIKRKSTRAKKLWISVFERRHIAKAAAIHVTSQYEKEELSRLGMRARHVFCLPNGVERAPTIKNVRDPLKIVFLGRISWKKGLERMIDAMKELPNARLVVAGNDDENLLPKLQAQAKTALVDSRIEFLGPVYGEAKWNLLASASIFVLPSHSENFGTSVLEAMACATPVVVTPEVGASEIVARFKSGVVCSGDPRVFASGVSSLLNDQSMARACGEAGRRAVEQQYSWPGIAAEMLEEYQRII